MTNDTQDAAGRPATAFIGHRILASGPVPHVALKVKAAMETSPDEAVLVFDDATGKVIDLDLRGDAEDIIARLTAAETPKPAGRGRPKLGVVAREVTLLPRHWDWLAAQPGGASQALRRLIDRARSDDAGQTGRKARQEAAYRFMSAMAGDLPGFEEASRALFAGDAASLMQKMGDWPLGIRDYALRLAGMGAGAD